MPKDTGILSQKNSDIEVLYDRMTPYVKGCSINYGSCDCVVNLFKVGRTVFLSGFIVPHVTGTDLVLLTVDSSCAPNGDVFSPLSSYSGNCGAVRIKATSGDVLFNIPIAEFAYVFSFTYTTPNF